MSHDGLSFLRIFPGISLDAEKKDCAPGKPKTEDVPIVCFFGFPYTYMILRPGIKDEVDVFCRSIGFSAHPRTTLVVGKDQEMVQKKGCSVYFFRVK